MEKIQITQTKSLIGQSQKPRQTMQALGLGRINHTVVHTATPAIMGMVRRVSHLVTVQKS